jgi:hypothetical protein
MSRESCFGASSISYPISYTISEYIDAVIFLVLKQEQMFHVRCRLTTVKTAKWTLIMITWTIIAVKYCPMMPQSGPNVQSFNGMPDWMNMTAEVINMAVESLLNPLEGHIPHVISLQEVIEVNERHHIHNRHYQSNTRSSRLLLMCT